MTQSASFFAVLRAPIISYGALVLEEIAIKLVAPYGPDTSDIDLNEMWLHAANFVFGAVDNVRWGCEPNIHSSPDVESIRISLDVEGQRMNQEYILPHFEKFETSLEFGNSPELEFICPVESRMKLNLSLT